MSIKQLSQNVRRGYMLPSSNSVYDGLKCCMNRENKKKGLPIITIKQTLDFIGTWGRNRTDTSLSNEGF
jgi:hypothetical protein